MRAFRKMEKVAFDRVKVALMESESLNIPVNNVLARIVLLRIRVLLTALAWTLLLNIVELEMVLKLMVAFSEVILVALLMDMVD